LSEAAPLRYCPYCGHQILDPTWVSYCSNCGHYLGRTTVPPEAVGSYPQATAYSGKKRVYFERSLSKSYWTWRRNQALVVPTMLSSSISVLSQSIFVIFWMFLLLDLEANGSLSKMASLASNARYSELVSLFFSKPVLYPFAILIGSAVLVAAVVSILADGFAISAEYISYRKALEGRTVSIGEAIYSGKDRWRAMVWTHFLTLTITYLPVGLAALAIFYSLYFSGGNLVALFSSLAFLSLAAVFSVLILFFTTYSTISVALEDLSGFAAIRSSFQKSTQYFGLTFTYAMVRIGLGGAIAVIGVLSEVIGLPLTSLASIAVTLLLLPTLHLTKTTIFREMTVPAEMELRNYGERSALSDLFRGPYARYAASILRRGLGTLRNYALAKRNLLYHFCSALAFVIGVYAGSYIAVHGLASAILALGYQKGQINPTILKDVPLSEGFDIFFHNWQVSLATALSGIWLVAPTLVTLGFNGVILGVVYYLTPNATMFVAAIFPHGIIEIPAFVIAGSTGMKLGVAFLRTLRFSKKTESSSASPEETLDAAKIRFHEVARETIYVLIGLAILFLVAGFIEGNITPIIMRAVGWH
jgi:stage II sporulation protein M